MNIKCFFGLHDWGRQENVREKIIDDSIFMLFLPTLFVTLFDPPKECDRKCLKCGKIKTFDYDYRK